MSEPRTGVSDAITAHAASLRADDLAATVLGRRASAYAESPPPADWDGIYVQTQK